MMNPLRRVDLKTTPEQAMEILCQSEYGFLSTINPDGTPHSVPIAFAVEGEYIYFHCARAGQKLDNLNRDNRASFSCVARYIPCPEKYNVAYSSCMVEGHVERVTDEAERTRSMKALVDKYCPGQWDSESCLRTMRGMPAVVMLRMKIENICGKANRGMV